VTFKRLILREADRQAQHGVQPARWAGPRNRRSRSVQRLEADAALAVGKSPLPALLDEVRAKRSGQSTEPGG
jgi:hypothetical protein